MSDTMGHNSGDDADAVDLNDLLKVLGECRDKQKTVSEATGALRVHRKGIIEDREWHKGAFAEVLKIDNLSETARADYLRTFDLLYRAMFAGQWAEEMRDMLASKNDGEPAEGGDE